MGELLGLMKEVIENRPEFFDVFAKFCKKFMVALEGENFSRDEAMVLLKIFIIGGEEE